MAWKHLWAHAGSWPDSLSAQGNPSWLKSDPYPSEGEDKKTAKTLGLPMSEQRSETPLAWPKTLKFLTQT